MYEAVINLRDAKYVIYKTRYADMGDKIYFYYANRSLVSLPNFFCPSVFLRYLLKFFFIAVEGEGTLTHNFLVVCRRKDGPDF